MRTYLPLVVSICLKLCRTLRKYEVQIKKGKTTEFQGLVDAAIVACQALEVAAAALIPPPTS